MFKIICVTIALFATVNGFPYPGGNEGLVHPNQANYPTQYFEGNQGPPQPGFLEHHPVVPGGRSEDLRNPAVVEAEKGIHGETDLNEGDKESLEASEFGWLWRSYPRYYYYYPRTYYYSYPRYYSSYWW